MAAVNRWIAVSAVSALGIGMLATSAIGVANALPLVDSSTASAVPPISTVPGDVNGSVGAGGITFPVPTSSADPASVVEQVSAPTPQPVVPQPVAPLPPAPTDDSAASVDSPASIDD